MNCWKLVSALGEIDIMYQKVVIRLKHRFVRFVDHTHRFTFRGFFVSEFGFMGGERVKTFSRITVSCFKTATD